MGKELRLFGGYSGWVADVAITPDGQRAVFVSYDRTLKVWDLRTGAVISTFKVDAAVRHCAWADGERIVAGDVWGRVHFFVLMDS